MIQRRLREITEPQLIALLTEIEQVKRLNVQDHGDFTLFNFLTLTQQHYITGRPERIQAADFYDGAILKTKIIKLQGTPAADLAEALCAHFNVSVEFIDGKKYYVFLNEIMNSKSKLRKPPRYW